MNHPGYEMFEGCFLFLHIYIHGCKMTKNTLKEHLTDIIHYTKVGKVEMGQAMILVEFLKNNYAESLEFCQRYV